MDEVLLEDVEASEDAAGALIEEALGEGMILAVEAIVEVTVDDPVDTHHIESQMSSLQPSPKLLMTGLARLREI